MQQLVIIKSQQYDNFEVKDIGGQYPDDSVLAGQTMIKFVDSFDTLEEAKGRYPSAILTHDLLMPQNTFDHLPDEPDC